MAQFLSITLRTTILLAKIEQSRQNHPLQAESLLSITQLTFHQTNR